MRARKQFQKEPKTLLCKIEIELSKEHIERAKKMAKKHNLPGHSVLELACIKGLDFVETFLLTRTSNQHTTQSNGKQ